MTHTPEEIATALIQENYPLEKYQKIQNRRIERMAYWKEHGLKPLIKNEQKLVDHGNKVMELMKIAYNNKQR